MFDLINIDVNDPLFRSIADVLALVHDGEPACERAADNAIGMMDQLPVFEFNGAALRIHSLTERKVYETDGETCSCKGKGWPWCKHRAIYRVLLAYAALRTPAQLRASLLAAAGSEAPAYDWRTAPRLNGGDSGEQAPLHDPDEPASLALSYIDCCQYCGRRLLDEELPIGLCNECQPQRPPAAAAVALPLRPSRVLQVNAAAQELADALLAA